MRSTQEGSKENRRGNNGRKNMEYIIEEENRQYVKER